MSHKIAKLERKLKLAEPLDDPVHWDEDVVPPFFDAQSFQERIDSRVGLNAEGKSIVRLIWGPKSIGLYDVPRYWIRRTKDGEGFRYATIKRWYLETRLERAQYFDSWNATRYGMTEPAEGAERCESCAAIDKPIETPMGRYCGVCGSTQLVKGEQVDKGPPPDEFFKFAWMCANHEAFDQDAGWPKCCERADKDGHKRCFGTFRSPNDYDLECISAGLRRRAEDAWIDPYAPLSAHDLAAIEMSSGLQTERMAAAIEARQAEIIRNENRIQDFGGSIHDVSGAFSKKPESLIYTQN